MNTIDNFAPFISASELTLTVALVVFVMLTILLTAIIVLLCISKSFRAFFFREHKNDGKNTDPALSDGQPAKTVPAEPTTTPVRSAPSETQSAQKPIRRKKHDDVFGGIPTIPLTFFPTDDGSTTKKRATPATKRNSAMGDGITTVEIPAISSPAERTVYTPRTIGRGRNGSQKQSADASDSQKKKHTPKNK